MKSPIQESFEQMAQDIMRSYKAKLATYTIPRYRVDCIKEMQAELLALKEAYEGLLSGPVMDCSFAENLGLEFNQA